LTGIGCFSKLSPLIAMHRPQKRNLAMQKLRSPLGLIVGISALVILTASAQEPKLHTAVSPLPREEVWMKRHQAFVDIAKKGGVDVLFLGDSITDDWGGDGHNRNAVGAKIFAKEFAPLKAANFGISGDRTQHVLWRLQNGEFDGIQPKVVMLMIGTNNSNDTDNTAEEIADGIKAIVKEIHKRSPKTKVLLLGIFPRANKKTPEANEKQTEKIRKVNAIVAKLDDGGKTVKYLDIGDKLSQPDGKIPREIMPDQLHLSERGYQIWADAVKGPLVELMKTNELGSAESKENSQ
jgi:lysophospholipase L1-like esterase